METYTLLRAFADSWMLLAMTLFFVGVVIWVFRPGAAAAQAEAAAIPLRDDDDDGCRGGCDRCGACKTLEAELRP